MALIALVIASMTFGYAAPAEGAVLGLAGAGLLMLISGKRRANFASMLGNSVCLAIATTLLMTAGGYFYLAIGATGFIERMVDAVDGLAMQWLAVAAIVAGLAAILSSFLDRIATLVLALGLPLAVPAEFDPFYFGIFVVLVVELTQALMPDPRAGRGEKASNRRSGLALDTGLVAVVAAAALLSRFEVAVRYSPLLRLPTARPDMKTVSAAFGEHVRGTPRPLGQRGLIRAIFLALLLGAMSIYCAGQCLAATAATRSKFTTNGESRFLKLPKNQWVKVRVSGKIMPRRRYHGGIAYDERRGTNTLFGADTHFRDMYNLVQAFDPITRKCRASFLSACRAS